MHKILCPLLAILDYTETFKLLNFTGDSVETVSVHIIDDGNPETFLGQLSSADGVVIPPNYCNCNIPFLTPSLVAIVVVPISY